MKKTLLTTTILMIAALLPPKHADAIAWLKPKAKVDQSFPLVFQCPVPGTVTEEVLERTGSKRCSGLAKFANGRLANCPALEVIFSMDASQHCDEAALADSWECISLQRRLKNEWIRTRGTMPCPQR